MRAPCVAPGLLPKCYSPQPYRSDRNLWRSISVKSTIERGENSKDNCARPPAVPGTTWGRQPLPSRQLRLWSTLYPICNYLQREFCGFFMSARARSSPLKMQNRTEPIVDKIFNSFFFIERKLVTLDQQTEQIGKSGNPAGAEFVNHQRHRS